MVQRLGGPSVKYIIFTGICVIKPSTLAAKASEEEATRLPRLRNFMLINFHGLTPKHIATHSAKCHNYINS